jgi:SAM-dependent methyltransferase
MDHTLEVYLQENRYEQPKEISRVLASLALESGLLVPGARVADFGCAAGEFLYHLSKVAPGPCYSGFDLLPELIEKARRHVPGVRFEAGSVLQPDLAPPGSLDVVFLAGVMSLLDDFRPCLENLLRWTRPGGRVYLFDLLNPHPVDVFLRYRSADGAEGHWNMFSRSLVAEFLAQRLGPDRFRSVPFEMPFDLAPQPEDPLRTWTFPAGGRRRFTNGLSMLLNLEILEIRP